MIDATKSKLKETGRKGKRRRFEYQNFPFQPFQTSDAELNMLLFPTETKIPVVIRVGEEFLSFLTQSGA